MLYNILINKFKKLTYVTYNEKYKNVNGNSYTERFIGKHPLLKPKFIIINNEIQGFKKINKKIESLEIFQIYFEIDYFVNDENIKEITQFDIYTEANIQVQDQLKEIIYLTTLFEDSIKFNRVFSVNEYSRESITLFSTLPDALIENDIDESNEQNKAFIEMVVDSKITIFIQFIKILDDLILKKKSLDDILKILKTIKTK
ncbi:MAG: hypothetical protein VW378_01130 [bacterium]